MRILVPLDGSDRAHAATLAARTVISGVPGQIIFFHASWPGIPVDQADRPIESELEALRELGLDVSLERRSTPRDEETGRVIADAANELQADLIVMTTHGRGGLGRFLFGSVTEQVIQCAEVPVMITPSGLAADWPGGHDASVLVALDGSDSAERVLAPVSDLARALSAEIVLSRVLTGENEPSADQAEQYLTSVSSSLKGAGVTARHVVRSGDPARTIAALAQELNVVAIAIGSYRENSRRVALGSVSMGIIRRSDVPILIG